ncbi:hypothetical protein Bbelb_001250 [Branchiostoma belcheri]|nr:hypothetical protein Bbelb_001250 [Branchiostoma belcheri]
MESLPNFYMEEITDADLDEIFGPMEVEEQTLEATPETEVSRVRFACLNEQQLGEIEEGRVEKTTECRCIGKANIVKGIPYTVKLMTLNALGPISKAHKSQSIRASDGYRCLEKRRNAGKKREYWEKRRNAGKKQECWEKRRNAWKERNARRKEGMLGKRRNAGRKEGIVGGKKECWEKKGCWEKRRNAWKNKEFWGKGNAGRKEGMLGEKKECWEKRRNAGEKEGMLGEKRECRISASFIKM